MKKKKKLLDNPVILLSLLAEFTDSINNAKLCV